MTLAFHVSGAFVSVFSHLFTWLSLPVLVGDLIGQPSLVGSVSILVYGSVSIN